MICLVIQQDTRWSERASPQRQITKKKRDCFKFSLFRTYGGEKRRYKKRQKPKKKINFILFFFGLYKISLFNFVNWYGGYCFFLFSTIIIIISSFFSSSSSFRSVGQMAGWLALVDCIHTTPYTNIHTHSLSHIYRFYNVNDDDDRPSDRRINA